MEPVKIPSSVMLDAMFKQLALPAPTYQTEGSETSYMETKVMFFPSGKFLARSAYPHSLRTYPVDTEEEGIEAAARQAIHYMKKEEKKELQDFNYHELKRQQKTNRGLVRQVEAKNLKINRKNNKLTQLTENHELCLKAVREAISRLNNIVSEHDGQNNISSIRSVADELRQQILLSTASLRAFGRYPRETGISEDEMPAEFYESADDDEDDYSGGENYDSDGRPTHYDV